MDFRPRHAPKAASVTVRAVLFDLDDTLFDHQHCARAALSAVRTLHPCLDGTEASWLENAHARILEELHLDVIAGRVDLTVARIERFRRLFRSAGVVASAEQSAQAASAYRQRYIEARTEVRGASALLAAVREQAQVVIVSNNLLEEQQEKLRHCGLDCHVDLLVVSEEAGTSKPDPRIFEIALERAGVVRSEAVMVGDSWVNDVEGARAAGIRPVWFNRERREAPGPGVEMIVSLEPVDDALRVILRITSSTERV